MMISPLRFLLFLITLLISFPTVAQQIPYYSAIRENWGLLNPAFLDFHYYDYVDYGFVNGERPNFFTSASFRHQFTNFKQTQEGIKQVNLKIEGYGNRVKLSGGLVFDKIGVFQELGAYGQFGYHIIPKKLMLGLSPKLQFMSLGLQEDDFADFVNDLTAQQVVGLNFLQFNVDAGASYTTPIGTGNIILGGGINNLYSSRYRKDLGLKKAPQLNAFAGFLFLLDRSTSINKQIEPILLVTTVPKSNQFWMGAYQAPKSITFDLSIRYSILKDEKQYKSTTDWRFGIGASSAGIINLELGMLPTAGSTLVLNFSIPTLNNTLGPGLELYFAFRDRYKWKKSHR